MLLDHMQDRSILQNPVSLRSSILHISRYTLLLLASPESVSDAFLAGLSFSKQLHLNPYLTWSLPKPQDQVNPFQVHRIFTHAHFGILFHNTCKSTSSMSLLGLILLQLLTWQQTQCQSKLRKRHQRLAAKCLFMRLPRSRASRSQSWIIRQLVWVLSMSHIWTAYLRGEQVELYNYYAVKKQKVSYSLPGEMRPNS